MRAVIAMAATHSAAPAMPAVCHAPREPGPQAAEIFDELGVDLGAVRHRRQPLLRFCLDSSEQRRLTDAGAAELHKRLGVDLRT